MHTIKSQPGKFEGNTSQLLARVVYNVIGNGMADAELGESNGFGYYAMVTGKRYTFLLSEDSQGFVFVDWGSHQECAERWAEIEAEYEDSQRKDGAR